MAIKHNRAKTSEGFLELLDKTLKEGCSSCLVCATCGGKLTIKSFYPKDPTLPSTLICRTCGIMYEVEVQ